MTNDDSALTFHKPKLTDAINFASDIAPYLNPDIAGYFASEIASYAWATSLPSPSPTVKAASSPARK